jgi:hypothetical protein
MSRTMEYAVARRAPSDCGPGKTVCLMKNSSDRPMSLGQGSTIVPRSLVGATQVRRDVVYGPAGCDGVAEYLATALLGPMRGLVGAADFDLAQDSEKVQRGDLADGSLPQSREDKGLESPAGFGECGRRQLGFLQGQPFASDGLEVISLGSLLGLALRARVDAGGEQLPCCLTSVAGELQGTSG